MVSHGFVWGPWSTRPQRDAGLHSAGSQRLRALRLAPLECLPHASKIAGFTTFGDRNETGAKHLHVYIDRYIHIYLYTYVHTYIHTYIHIYIYIHIVYLYICNCVCVYKSMIHKYRSINIYRDMWTYIPHQRTVLNDSLEIKGTASCNGGQRFRDRNVLKPPRTPSGWMVFHLVDR